MQAAASKTLRAVLHTAMSWMPHMELWDSTYTLMGSGLGMTLVFCASAFY